MPEDQDTVSTTTASRSADASSSSSGSSSAPASSSSVSAMGSTNTFALARRLDILDSSRLSILTIASIASGALPIPVVPARVQRRIRGAIVHDIAARSGLSLTVDAREVLADPTPPDGSAVLRGALGLLLKQLSRRVGLLAALAPAQAGIEVFALGLLFERYVRQVRRGPSVRIHATEARAIRDLIGRAVVRTLSWSLTPSERNAAATAPEDFRDEWTRLIDSTLLGGADVPGYLVRRLEGAFDVIVTEHPELVDG